MGAFLVFSENVTDMLNGLADTPSAILPYCTFIIRILLPALAAIIVYRCLKSFFREKHDDEIWGYLSIANGVKLPLYHWENIIGRSASSDVFIDYPSVSRTHAAIARDDKGSWSVLDLGSKTGVYLNNELIEGSAPIEYGDEITLGGVDIVFFPHTADDEREQAEVRTRPGKVVRPGATFVFLTEFQLLLGAQLCIANSEAINAAIPISFGALIIIMWMYYFAMRLLRRVGFEIETLAFFLTTLGFAVTASSAPSGLYKQVMCLLIGITLLLLLGAFLRDLNIAQKLRWPAAIGGVILLIFNLVAAEAIFGAKNWISIGGVSLQPSEFVKICFVFAGAAALDRLFAKRNLLLFILFAGACVGSLALMSDFGTAIIFFVAYLVISYLRSGSFATVFLSIAGAGFAGMLALMIKPHIAARFETWGNAWEFANAGGYQQTRTMSAAASGGLFGVGAGNGWLHNVFAADTDMVFGMVCEEMGLIIAVLAAFSLIALALFAIKSAGNARSSFYVIGACAAVSILLFQTILNVFGSVDMLPFTGVTFPFVSKGGSSLIVCWGLLAFIKAADTRQNASFVVKLPKRVRWRRKAQVQNYEED